MDGIAETAGVAGAEDGLTSPKADAALARRISSGDVVAWEAFFEQYAPWAYRFAYHHLDSNHADAEDLCSDILMVAARAIKGYDPRLGTLDTWLLGLARHRLSRFCRQRRREPAIVPEVNVSEANPETPISDPWTEASHQRDLVNRALASLPPRQADVLVGKYVSGYTVEELARRTQSTPKAVESLLSRGRAAFRSAFAGLLESGSRGENNA